MKKIFLLAFVFMLIQYLWSQEEALQSEVSKKKGLIYYEGRPFSGWLLSDETISGNECECTLKVRYKNGKKSGLMQQWYRNGQLKYSGYYKNNIKVGEHKYYYPSGRLKKIERYKSGGIVEKTYYLRNGKKQKYEKYKNGVLVDTIDYIKPEEQTKPVLRTRETRNIESVRKNTNHAGNVIQLTGPDEEVEIQPLDNGLQKILYPGGIPKRVIFYRNGVIAKDSLFYPSGQLQKSMKFEDGELIHSEKYSESGQLVEENNFSNNQKNGYQRKFYENGQLHIVEFYNMGQLEHLEVYSESGKQEKEENFRFGKPHGEQKYYDENGQLKEYKIYDSGILKKHEKYTDEGKEIISVSNDLARVEVYDKQNRLKNIHFENIKTNQLDSLWVDYDNQGHKIKEILYKNGRIYRKGKYKNDKKDGLWVYYWPNKVGETQKKYREGELVSTKEIDYRRQVKNLMRKGDVLFKYSLYTPEKKDLYILVQKDFPLATNTDSLIIETFLDAAKEVGLQQIYSPESIEDEQIYQIIKLSDLNTRIRRSKTNSNKLVFLMSIMITIKDLGKREEYENRWIITPVTKERPGITSHYTSDIQKAVSETLSNFISKSEVLLLKYFPLKGIARKKTVQNGYVSEIYINLGENVGVKKGFRFKMMDNERILAEAYVISVSPDFSVAKISKGGKDLRTYFNLHNKIIVERYK